MYAASLETREGLRNEWNELLRRSSANTVFSTWEWQDAWLRHFRGESEPHLLAIRRDGKLIGLTPLIIREGVLSLAGGTDVSDYLDVIAERGNEEQVLAYLLDHLRVLTWNRLEMHFLRQGSPTLTILPRMALEEGLGVSQQVDDQCPFVDLPGDWDAYLNSLPKKDRHELRRKMRRLESEASVRWVLLLPEEMSARDLDDFVSLCRLSRHEKAHFMGERMEAFFRSVVADLRPLDVVRLYFLELDGRRVSTALCFSQGSELWLYNSGYDPAYSSLSVGLLLKAHCIRDAIEKRKSRFDFLRGVERYKYDLGGTDSPVFGLTIRPT